MKRISLYPLSFDDAISALLRVKPMESKKEKPTFDMPPNTCPAKVRSCFECPYSDCVVEM